MEIAKYKQVCLDSNIFAYYLANDPRYFKTIHRIFSLVEKSKLKLVISVITMLEVMSAPHLEGDRILQEKYSRVFTSYPNLILVDVNVDVAIEAARLRRLHPSLRTPDSLLLATSIISHSDVFITNDLRLRSISEIKTLTLESLVSKK